MNFDLCGKCFTEYTGPDIQLKEAVLIRDKKLSRDFVLKLRINNGGEGASFFPTTACSFFVCFQCRRLIHCAFFPPLL